MKPKTQLSLCGDAWKVRETGSAEDPIPATVPGTVHTDLMAAGRIPDPFIGTQEKDVQWVGEKDWAWRLEFDAPAAMRERERVELILEGVDTVAEIRLNGERVAATDNMYVPVRIDVKDRLAAKNTLEVQIASPLRIGRAREAEAGLPMIECYQQPAPYVRKAPYSFAWDWGPKLPTSGLWRPVFIEAFDARLADVWPKAVLAADLGSAELEVVVEVEAAHAGTALLVVELSGHGTELRSERVVELTAGRSTHDVRLQITSPKLWWPAGYGDQPLYAVTTRLIGKTGAGAQNERALDTDTRRLGFRRMALAQEGGAGEEGFVFRVNDRDIFCRGGNWIPDDSFLPRISEAHYRKSVHRAREAGMNMLRVWGGGIYESDTFYDLCDEMGILVWQDFIFACALYPDHLEWFRESVRLEAEENVRRLRGRTSLALMCGNNECHQGWYEWGWQKKGTWDRFYGETLYHQILPAVMAELAPEVPYWPGSPLGGEHPNSEKAGDMHCWAVWHCQEPAEYYEKLRCRFLSEFGFEAAPAEKTVRAMTADPQEDLRPGSPVLLHHERCANGPVKLAQYLETEFGAPTEDLALWIYRTQYVQAHCVGTALRHTRRLFPHCGGVLFWQHNDCWPVVSWSCIDDVGRPKALWYQARRDFAPTACAIAHENGTLSVSLLGNRPSDLPRGEVRIRLLDFSGASRFSALVPFRGGSEAQSVEVWRAREGDVGIGDGRGVILVADYESEGQRLARVIRTFVPAKNQPWGASRLEIDAQPSARGGYDVTVSSECVALGVVLTSHGDPSPFSDNFFTVLPGEPVTVWSSSRDELRALHAGSGLS